MMEVIMILIVVIVVIGVVAGAVMSFFSRLGNKDKDKGKERKIGDGYFYFMAFVSLLVLYWGVSDLLRVILEKWWAGGVSSATTARITYSAARVNATQEVWLRGLALRVSAILVGIPFWLFHWHKASNKPKEDVDLGGRKSYLFAIVVVMGLASIGMLIYAVYLAVTWMIGITLTAGEVRWLAYLLPYSIGAVGLWWTHWRLWQAMRLKEAGETDKVADAPVEEKKEEKTEEKPESKPEEKPAGEEVK